jgi:hypothetical protein
MNIHRHDAHPTLPAHPHTTAIGVMGVLLLLFTGLSFARGIWPGVTEAPRIVGHATPGYPRG